MNFNNTLFKDRGNVSALAAAVGIILTLVFYTIGNSGSVSFSIAAAATTTATAEAIDYNTTTMTPSQANTTTTTNTTNHTAINNELTNRTAAATTGTNNDSKPSAYIFDNNDIYTIQIPSGWAIANTTFTSNNATTSSSSSFMSLRNSSSSSTSSLPPLGPVSSAKNSSNNSFAPREAVLPDLTHVKKDNSFTFLRINVSNSSSHYPSLFSENQTSASTINASPEQQQEQFKSQFQMDVLLLKSILEPHNITVTSIDYGRYKIDGTDAGSFEITLPLKSTAIDLKDHAINFTALVVVAPLNNYHYHYQNGSSNIGIINSTSGNNNSTYRIGNAISSYSTSGSNSSTNNNITTNKTMTIIFLTLQNQYQKILPEANQMIASIRINDTNINNTINGGGSSNTPVSAAPPTNQMINNILITTTKK